MSKGKILRGLLVAYYFPPLNTIATHRLYSFAKYLNTGDMQLDVISPQWDGDLHYDIKDVRIFHTSKRKFDGNFGKVKSSPIVALRNFFFNKILKRNYFVSSKPGKFCAEVLERTEGLDMKQYDFIITSYAPLDAIHAGRQLKKKFPHLRWIVDYRDLYSQLEYFDMGLMRPYFKQLERAITAEMDGFITVSKVLLHKQEHLLGKKGRLIYNGFENFEYSPDTSFLGTVNDLPVISYGGSLYEGERDIKPFLTFVKEKGLDKKFRLVFALINDFDEKYLKDIVSSLQLENIMILRDLNHNQMLSLEHVSRFLLLFANFGKRGNGYLTGKIFEYMPSGRSVIYSGSTDDDYELYQLIRDNRLGESFEKIDYTKQDAEYSISDVMVFHRRNQAELLKKYITSLCTNG
jgi:hypothetical protein